MSTTNVFLSVLPSIFFEVLDYCEACDVMALRFTCRTCNTRIDELTLVVDRLLDMDTACEIPIYVADHCHSVFLRCRLRLSRHRGSHHTITIKSRTKHQKEPFATVVWTKRIPRRDCHRESYIGFRTVPSQEYQLSYDGEYHDDDNHDVTIRKQFMMASFTLTRRRALSACWAMRSVKLDTWSVVKLSGINVMRLFVKLFVLSYASSSEVSSPIHRVFTGPWDTIDPDAIIQQIINLFEQILEQKEPTDCRKLPLAMDENQNLQHLWRFEWWENICRLPLLMLNEEFTWKRGKRWHLDQTEDNLYHNELKFIVRIPLQNKTRGFFLKATLDTDSMMPLFVMFFQNFQRKRNGMDDTLENLVEGNAFTDPQLLFSNHIGRHFDVKPEHEACFHYFVPGTASRMVVADIEVLLEIARDDYNDEFTRWMEHLIEYDSTASLEEFELPLILFGACASAIRGPNAQRYAAWKEAFDMEGLDTTPHGLQCIVEIANELLDHPQIGYPL